MTGVEWTHIDNHQFERIVDAVLDRIYGARGYAPEGRGGDQGIDYTVDDNKIIYQYKFYPGGENTSSRRRQIKASFIEAMKHDPDEWIVIIPAKVLPGLKTYILGLGADTPTKIGIHDRAWLDNRLAEFSDLGEYFQYRSGPDYLFAQADALKVNPMFRRGGDIDDKIATLQRAINASDKDWTFDLSTSGGDIIRTLRPKHANAQQRAPIEITFTTAIPDDDPQRRRFELSWDYGVVDPVRITGSMVRDLKISGPSLVAYEGPVAGLELLPDPDGASPWANTDIKIMDKSERRLSTHLARSRLVGRGRKGLTIEVEVGSLLRMLFRSPDNEGEGGNVEFTTGDFGGHPVEEALAVSRLLCQLRRDATIDFQVEGSRLMRILLTGVGSDWPDRFAEVLGLAEDLAVVERETSNRFRYPRTMTGLDRINVRNARLMLEGHVVVHPTHNQINGTLTEAPGPEFDSILSGEHGWLVQTMSPAEITVLQEAVVVPELAVGGPARLSEERIAAVRQAIAAGTAEGTPLEFRVGQDDRLRMWLPDRFKGKVLAITPWNLPGIELPEGCRAGVIDGSAGFDETGPPVNPAPPPNP